MRAWADDALLVGAAPPKRRRRRRWKSLSAYSALSAAELRVVALVALGWEDKRVAVELGVARTTVKTHLLHAREKLGLDNRVQIAVWYVRAGKMS